MPPPIEVEILKLIPPALPIDRPRSFDKATDLVATSEQDVYSVQLRADWAYGPRAYLKGRVLDCLEADTIPGANGGYLVGILLKAAEKTCLRLGNKQRDPVSWTSHFLSPAAVGPAEVKAHILRTNSVSTMLRIDLRQSGVLCVEITVVQGDLKAAQRHPLKLPPAAMPDLPFEKLRGKNGKVTESAMKEQGWLSRNMSEYQQFYPTKPEVKFYLPPGSDLYNSRHIVHPTLGAHFRDMWVTYGTKDPLRPSNLPVAIDSFVPMHLNFPEGVNHFIATQSITCEMKMTCGDEGWDWLFGRAELKECSGGKYVVDATIFNTSGEIVGLARLVQVLIPIGMLMGRGKKSKKPKATL